MPTIPPLLDIHLKPAPSGSLTLVTSVLDATSNWLLLRFIYAATRDVKATNQPSTAADSPEGQQENVDQRYTVILLSFLRNLDFWKSEGRRVGIDLGSLISQRRFLFIDGLSHFFLQPANTGPTLPAPQQIPVTFSNLHTLRDTLTAQIGSWLKASAPPSTNESKTVLILDAPDFLVAAIPDPEVSTGASIPQSTIALDMNKLCLTLRSIPSVQNMVISVSADPPLLHKSSTATPLEIQHRTFLLFLAQSARTALQLRPLGSGSAKDVSGVIRVNRGGAWDDWGKEMRSRDQGVSSPQVENEQPEGEWLYHISGNGDVKVWGRGEAGAG